MEDKEYIDVFYPDWIKYLGIVGIPLLTIVSSGNTSEYKTRIIDHNDSRIKKRLEFTGEIALDMQYFLPLVLIVPMGTHIPL